ncbi:MAG: AMP-dependent synthetase/ligase [Algibacter sp.]|uniref:AMP-dependent synthetase/ligase n=1 Tax=Algibacter sp. TaxID=1872428 RepID=UPI00261CB5E8|nr:AMP-dependent synthetase/ligase [Algibacter sp.]MDG1729185.1 AMP-dependent synthetase/ligase [Algibacter sp.]MDG2178442.1 AMP-dependent synthetase/ligase [Algibacter sp.]
MIEVTRLFDFPYYQMENAPLEAALVTKYNGKWIETNTKDYLNKANALSRALLKLGVKKDDKIAIISSSNRTEWNITDIGVLQTGAQTVPIYPTISPEDYEYILNHSESIYCFVSDDDVLEKINKIKSKTGLKDVFSFDTIKGCKNYSELFELGKDNSNQNELDTRKDEVKSIDLATIIYTSGTTGKPKGVMLSHWNIVSNVFAVSKRFPLKPNDKTLSFLPVCHIFERVFLYVCQYCSISIYFAESIDKIGDNLKEVKPNVITVVPRLIEKVYDKIMAKAEELTGIKRKLFFWAVDLGATFQPYKQNGWWYELKLAIARKLIFSKWQEAMGGNIVFMASGSAALQPRLGHLFGAANMPIMECYGLTETSPGVTVSDRRNRGWKIGSVGRVLDKCEVKIADDGEILCKGPNIMMGYYKDPEKTASVMTGDYFHTGDKGEIDTDGFLKITGRKKEMFKTSGGKYIVPTLLENDLKQSRFIEQIMIIGEGEKMPAALIQPNFEFVKEWIEHKKYPIGNSFEDIANSDVIQKRIQKEVNKCNQKFGKWEQIKVFKLTPEVWSIDGGHLTPTLKMKRDVIKNMYHNLIENIYRP